jgi:hypothetical protein
VDPIEALHNAARHYCTERHAEWRRKYAQLGAEGRGRAKDSAGQWTYSDAAYDVFPRYNVLDAILNEIERFVPGDFSSIEEAASLLAVAGETATNLFTDDSNPIAVRAMADERQRYAAFLAKVDVAQLAKAPRLPFRRVLGNDEHARRHQEFIRNWGKWYGGFRDDGGNERLDVVTLHVEAMNRPGAYEHLRHSLVEHGFDRIFELREWGNGYEIETAAATFRYSGAEGFWTSDPMDWMVYASHEDSITIGGSWPIEAMKARLPAFERYRYRGWDLSAYPEE